MPRTFWDRFWNPEEVSRGFCSLNHYVLRPDIEALRMLVRYFCSDQPCMCEVGVYAGATSLALIDAAMPEEGYREDVRLLCVDNWKVNAATDPSGCAIGDVVYQTFKENMARETWTREHALPVRLDSLEAAAMARDGEFSLVFLDADHSLEAVSADLAAWGPKVRPGGILCGHDFNIFEGVTAAVLAHGLDGLMGTVWWKVVGTPPIFQAQAHFPS